MEIKLANKGISKIILGPRVFYRHNSRDSVILRIIESRDSNRYS